MLGDKIAYCHPTPPAHDDVLASLSSPQIFILSDGDKP